MENVHRTLVPSIILLRLGGIQAEPGSGCNGALAKVWPTSQNSLKDALVCTMRVCRKDSNGVE